MLSRLELQIGGLDRRLKEFANRIREAKSKMKEKNQGRGSGSATSPTSPVSGARLAPEDGTLTTSQQHNLSEDISDLQHRISVSEAECSELKNHQEIQRSVYTEEIKFLDTALVYDTGVNKCL